MKLRDIMTTQVIRIAPEETAAVAARTMARYNIGSLPVCGSDGRLQGVLTDRDIVTRCLAANRTPENTTVREIMTKQVVTAGADLDTSLAAGLMGRRQVRRLPILENERLCGMVSLGDLAASQESEIDAGDALSEISSPLSRRE